MLKTKHLAPARGQGFFHGMDAVENFCFQSDPILRPTPAVVRRLNAEPFFTSAAGSIRIHDVDQFRDRRFEVIVHDDVAVDAPLRHLPPGVVYPHGDHLRAVRAPRHQPLPQRLQGGRHDEDRDALRCRIS